GTSGAETRGPDPLREEKSTSPCDALGSRVGPGRGIPPASGLELQGEGPFYKAPGRFVQNSSTRGFSLKNVPGTADKDRFPHGRLRRGPSGEEAFPGHAPPPAHGAVS